MYSPNLFIMKNLTVTSCLLAIAICILSSCATKPSCDHKTLICCDFMLDIPAGFTGEMTEDVYLERTATVTAENCEGPFKIVLTNADGTVEPAKIFERGELTADTMYIEQPDPPYDLAMHVETIYRAKEVK